MENTTNNHMVIRMQAEDYQQLGIIVGAIKTQGNLNNVVVVSTDKLENLVRVTIEGDLP